MKHKTLQFIIATFIALTFPLLVFAQSPNLRSSINFAVFTTTGAVSNTGISTITGDIGTNTGAITGFGLPTLVDGTIHLPNSVTSQCVSDVQAAYDEILAIPATVIGHAPAFGGGEILLAGVYYIASAGSIAGNIVLDAEGNSDALFIFKFGGAFSTGSVATVNLINGASACNIFWIAAGAIDMAASTDIKGTIISNNGAVSMGSNGLLVGRMLSTTGAVSLNNTSVSIPTSTCEGIILSIGLSSFTGYCDNQNIILQWKTATETNNDYFTIERSQNGINWSIVGTVDGATNSSAPHSYSLMDMNDNKVETYYRLKQTDFDGTYKYANIITMNKCNDSGVDYFTIYPNPSTRKFKLLFNGNTSEISSINIFNSLGQNIHSSIGFQSTFDLSSNLPGFYLIRIQHNAEIITLKFILK